MVRNGDMIRPQVKAVMDLIIAGIEIDHDFGVGYENLVLATTTKSKDSLSELSDFMQRLTSPEHPISIPSTAKLMSNRIQARREEVHALLEASQAHVIADHSKLEVILSSAERDISEWNTLTLQLIENSFHDAESNYLSNLWPSPPLTPREEVIPEDEDRVKRLKEILAKESAESAGAGEKNNSNYLQNLMIATAGSNIIPTTTTTSNNNSLVLYDNNSNNNNLPPTENNLVSYKGDMKVLLDALAVDAEESQERENYLAQKKAAKEKKKLDKQQLALAEKKKRRQDRLQKYQNAAEQGQGEVKKHVPELQTRECQQGWFECTSVDGYIYYHNPETNESLWDLPQSLKQYLHPEDDQDEIDDASSALTLHTQPQQQQQQPPAAIIETPRELVMTTNNLESLYPKQTIPVRVVPTDYQLTVSIDPKIIMSEIAEEARAISSMVVDTAVEITNIITGHHHQQKKRHPNTSKSPSRSKYTEEEIISKLGDRYHPDALQKFLQDRLASDDNSDAEDEHRLALLKSTDRLAVDEEDTDSMVDQQLQGPPSVISFNSKGHVVTSGDGDGEDGTTEEVNRLMRELALGPDDHHSHLALIHHAQTPPRYVRS